MARDWADEQLGDEKMPGWKPHTVAGLSTLQKSIRNLISILALLSAIGVSHADEHINPTSHYPSVAAAINATMRAYHYDPEELETPEYPRIESAISALAGECRDPDRKQDDGARYH